MRRVLPFLLVAVAAAGRAQAPDAPVATVNGEAIRASEYYHRLEWFVPSPNSVYRDQPAGFQVLRQMISERMILQLAKSKGLAPSAPEVDARLAAVYADNPGLKASLAATGQTEGDLRSEVAAQEAQFKLLTAGITITDLEVEKFYRETPAEFRVPARYRLSVIAVKDDAGQNAVDAALKGGKGFADAAKEFSLDPATKAAGGSYGEVTEDQLAPATLKVVAATPAGKTSGWVKGEGTETRVKFFVESVTPGKALPLDAGLKSRIRRRLMLDRGNVKNAGLGKDLEAATRAANVTIVQPQFQKLYTSLQDRVKGQG